jgi:hypothetical protein
LQTMERCATCRCHRGHSHMVARLIQPDGVRVRRCGPRRLAQPFAQRLFKRLQIERLDKGGEPGDGLPLVEFATVAVATPRRSSGSSPFMAAMVSMISSIISGARLGDLPAKAGARRRQVLRTYVTDWVPIDVTPSFPQAGIRAGPCLPSAPMAQI